MNQTVTEVKFNHVSNFFKVKKLSTDVVTLQNPEKNNNKKTEFHFQSMHQCLKVL